MRSRYLMSLLAVLLVLAMAGCSRPTSNEPGSEQGGTTAANKSGASGQSKPGLLDRLTGKPITLPEGTVLTVRLGQELGSKISTTGDTFAATVAEPVTADNKVVIPEGATAEGSVIEAVPRGKFKGAGKLRIELTSVTINGTKYDISTAPFARASKGKGKRTATMIGGGAGAGAIIGAIAGGGKGAAIGALVGGGAGTAGSYFTGNKKDVLLPAESAISFKLLQPVEIKP